MVLEASNRTIALASRNSNAPCFEFNSPTTCVVLKAPAKKKHPNVPPPIRMNDKKINKNLFFGDRLKKSETQSGLFVASQHVSYHSLFGSKTNYN